MYLTAEGLSTCSGRKAFFEIWERDEPLGFNDDVGRVEAIFDNGSAKAEWVAERERWIQDNPPETYDPEFYFEAWSNNSSIQTSGILRVGRNLDVPECILKGAFWESARVEEFNDANLTAIGNPDGCSNRTAIATIKDWQKVATRLAMPMVSGRGFISWTAEREAWVNNSQQNPEFVFEVTIDNSSVRSRPLQVIPGSASNVEKRWCRITQLAWNPPYAQIGATVRVNVFTNSYCEKLQLQLSVHVCAPTRWSEMFGGIPHPCYGRKSLGDGLKTTPVTAGRAFAEWDIDRSKVGALGIQGEVVATVVPAFLWEGAPAAKLTILG